MRLLQTFSFQQHRGTLRVLISYYDIIYMCFSSADDNRMQMHIHSASQCVHRVFEWVSETQWQRPTFMHAAATAQEKRL